MNTNYPLLFLPGYSIDNTFLDIAGEDKCKIFRSRRQGHYMKENPWTTKKKLLLDPYEDVVYK